MLAIFLSFRVTGAAAALIGAAERQARFDRALDQGRSALPLVMRRWENPRQNEMPMNAELECRDFDPGSVSGRDVCGKRAIPGAASDRG